MKTKNEILEQVDLLAEFKKDFLTNKSGIDISMFNMMINSTQLALLWSIGANEEEPIKKITKTFIKL